jgi:hypothetical protein
MQRLLNKREKVTLYLAIFIVAASVCFNFIIYPILAKNSSLNREIDAARVKLKKYRWLLSQKERLQIKYNNFNSAFKASAPGADTSIITLSQLETMAKNANLRIVDIRPERSKDKGSYKEFVVELRTEGQMEGYLKFIYDIENSLLLLKIKKFQLMAKNSAQILEGTFIILQPSFLE